MLDAASSTPGSPKRSSIERTLTFESFPCGPAGDTLTEKPRGPTRLIVQWVPDRATRIREVATPCGTGCDDGDGPVFFATLWPTRSSPA